jgi:hypothetical protein
MATYFDISLSETMLNPNNNQPIPFVGSVQQDITPVTTQDDLIFGFEPQTLMIMGAIGIGFFIFMSGK